MTSGTVAPLSPEISVIVATLNRAPQLARALESLAAVRAADWRWEIVVADNGSTDGTRGTVERFARGSSIPVRYIFEPRGGVSYARNAGARASSAAIVAFIDDDEEVTPEWLEVIFRTYTAHPSVDVLGGRVLPRWHEPPPAWVTPRLWGPVSIIDRGTEAFRVSCERWMCLPGGNTAWRRQAFLEMGGYAAEYARSQDREITVRCLLAGREGMYVPEMVVHHHLDGARLTKAFFRSWNRTEGRMRAGYAFEELFAPDGRMRPVPAGGRRLLGVSRFVYRELLAAGRSYIAALAQRRWIDAFVAETRLLYLLSYIRRRIELTATGDTSMTHRTGAVICRGLSRLGAAIAGLLAAVRHT